MFKKRLAAIDNQLQFLLYKGLGKEQYQAALTRDFYTLAFSHPLVESITWWTITDLIHEEECLRACFR